VSAGSKDEVRACESGHLGDAQTRLDRDQKKRMIAPTRPGALIGRGQQGIDFRTREKLDQRAGKPLTGNGEHPLNLGGVGRGLERRVPKERMEGGQP
jgi:hypothetical protein